MIVNLIMLVLATVATFVFLRSLFRGKKYAYMVESLDAKKYFMKDFYVVGFFLNEGKLFRLRGKLERDLKKDAKLVWGEKYCEYYAVLAWVQFLTWTLFACSVGLIIAGLAKGQQVMIILFLLVLFTAAFWNLAISNMKEAVQKRREECEAEFPNMVSKLALLINSGMVLREAWYIVAKGKEGALYDLMKSTCQNMENGESDVEAIYKFGVLSDSSDIKKFTSAMIQGIQKGNSELADFMMNQTSELWAHKRQISLQKGEVAAGKLIIPLGITFGGIIMIIVSAAMQSMSF